MSYAVTSIDDFQEFSYREARLRPVRHHFGITAFGVNAWTAEAPGELLVPEHAQDEDEDEELYLVLRGRAVFEIDGSSRGPPSQRRPEPRSSSSAARPGAPSTRVAGSSGGNSTRSTGPASTPRSQTGAASCSRSTRTR
jgi:hypothetical protein